MKKRFRYLSMILAAVLLGGMFSAALPVTARGAEKVKIEPAAWDLLEIPDQYNTGVSGNLIVFASEEGLATLSVSANGMPAEVFLKKSGQEGTYNLNFDQAQNRELTGTVEISDQDFSAYKLNTLGAEKLDHPLTFVFHNCRFDVLSKENLDSPLTFVFENCSIRRFTGSNARFENCAFGGSNQDPLVPFRNVTVKNSYFSDLNYPGTEKETHIDATQIYGYAYKDKTTGETIRSDVENILFQNCRFEVPNILFDEANKATVNACVMLQLEYASGHNITVEDCLLNGGSQTIFAHCTSEDLSMDNVTFRNIKIGAAKYNGHLYQKVDEHVKFEHVTGLDALFIGSVIQKDGKTSFSVSNDTGRERKLRIITNRDTYDFTIEAGACRESLDERKYSSFSDLPEDRLFTIDEQCEYALCLDVTEESFIKQIRFFNPAGKDVYLDATVFGTDEVRANPCILEGECGKQVSFSLSKDYVLTISGNGVMTDYHSKRLPPWNDYKDLIKKIVVCEGVESIGNQAFMGCFALEEVVLADGIKEIRDKSFRNCSTMERINIPESLTAISESAFQGVVKKDLLTSEKEEGDQDKDKKTEGDGNKDGDEKKDGDGNIVGDGNTDGSAAKSPAEEGSQNPPGTDTLKAGDLIKDPKTGFVYQVKKVKAVPELTLIGIAKKKKKLTVKSSIRIDGKRYQVTAIGKDAFQKTRKKVETITIAKGVKRIAKGALKGCNHLKKVVSKNRKFTKKYLRKRGFH